jgi:hypothetical protein
MDRKTTPQIVLKYDDRHPPLALLCVAGLPHLKTLVKLEADAKQSVPLLHSAIGDLTTENTIIRYLARLVDSSLPSHSHLYGSDPFSASQVDHLLYLSASSFSQKDGLPEALAALNVHLQMRTFLVGRSLTIADIVVWNALQANRRFASLVKLPECVHIARWFAFLQVQSHICNKKNICAFSLCSLYPSLLLLKPCSKMSRRLSMQKRAQVHWKFRSRVPRWAKS